MMSQINTRLGLAANGSMTAGAGSGIRIMSDSLIAFQPAIDDPSNMKPSVKTSASTVETCCAVCCHLPRGSVNRRSTYSTEFSVSMLSTLLTAALESSGFIAIPDFPVANQVAARPPPITGRDRWKVRTTRNLLIRPSTQSAEGRWRLRKLLDCVLPSLAGADTDD